ncbi:hypothetical protein JCM1840_006538 [Sporobolomyces johnsonii]
MADLWLKADYPIGPFASQPIEQAVADVLAKAPWAAWQTGEVSFRYDLLDRPDAGTALLALLNPPQRPPPADGLRYLVPESHERRTVTRHTVSCPVNISAPTQNQPIQVELECFTSMHGHLPPLNRNQALPPDSPELRLFRFRKRWRITNGQYPGLWFFWWGRDEHGGAGGGGAPMAPPGWDRSPVRAYPLVRDPNVPNQPMYPFPGPGRMPQGMGAAGAGAGGAQAAMIAGPGGAMGAPGTPQSRMNPAAAFTPAQQQPQLSTNPYARQEQLAALAGTPLGMGTGNPTLEARQAQYLAQQQQQQARAAAGYGAPPGAAPAPNYPYAMNPAQMQQAQQALAQQQAAQRLAAQQQQAAAAAAANNRAQQAQRKPVVAPSAPAAAPPPSVPPSAQHALELEAPSHDILDVLTSRQLAIHRLAKNQDLVAPILDAWTVPAILAGQKRKREVEEAIRTGAVSTRTGESRGGVAGLGREHSLTLLGTSAARVAVMGAMGKDPAKAIIPLEERKARLSKMLEEVEKETEAMQKRHEEQVAKVKAQPV